MHMITPEQRLKFQIKSELHMDGKYVEGRQLDEIVNRIYTALFNRNMRPLLWIVITDIESQPDADDTRLAGQ